MPGVSSERESEFTPVRAHAARGGHCRRMGSRPTQVTRAIGSKGREGRNRRIQPREPLTFSSWRPHGHHLTLDSRARA